MKKVVDCISGLGHQQKIFPSRWNSSVRVDALLQGRQRHPDGRLLRARHQFNVSRSISPTDRCCTITSRSVGLLFYTITLLLGLTVTIHRNGFVGYALPSGLHCDGWRCRNLSSRSFYLRAKCNSLITNYAHYSTSPELCGYWQSIVRSVRLLSYY
jgi:hypothetical protein